MLRIAVAEYIQRSRQHWFQHAGVSRKHSTQRKDRVGQTLNENTLAAALSRHSIELPPDQIKRLRRYCDLRADWNQRLNLTRHLDPATFVARDLIDTMQLSEQLAASQRVLDVGTGGGVPGIPLAILRPDLEIALCESSKKKAQAVTAILSDLKMKMPVYAERVETVLTQHQFDVLVARAVGPMWKILRWLKPHWGAFHQLILVKGPKWVDERAEARHKGYLKTLQLRCLSSYQPPGHDGQSVILGVWQNEEQN